MYDLFGDIEIIKRKNEWKIFNTGVANEIDVIVTFNGEDIKVVGLGSCRWQTEIKEAVIEELERERGKRKDKESEITKEEWQDILNSLEYTLSALKLDARFHEGARKEVEKQEKLIDKVDQIIKSIEEV